jgi:hypothetical protein
MLVKELREKLRLIRKETLKPVCDMKKDEIVAELEKMGQKVEVEVKVPKKKRVHIEASVDTGSEVASAGASAKAKAKPKKSD